MSFIADDSDLDTYMHKPVAADRETASLPNLLWFSADWCGHCTAFKKTWEELQDEKKSALSGKVNFVKLDCTGTDDCLEEREKYHVNAFPTIVLERKNGFDIFNGQRTALAISEFVETRR